MKISIAQINPIVGDIAGNLDIITSAHVHAAREGADIAVFSELCITGYPPEDLVFRPGFQQDAFAAVHRLAELTEGDAPALLVGGIWRDALDSQRQRPLVGQFESGLYNAAFLLDDGVIKGIFRKFLLPNYDVFDEKRIFSSGRLSDAVLWRGIRLGVLLCADLWSDEVVQYTQSQNPDLLVSLNGSPYTLGKRAARHAVVQKVVKATKAPLIYVNQVGGQDELAFDGASFVMHPGEKKPICALTPWQSEQRLTEWQQEKRGWQCQTECTPDSLSEEEELYSASVIATRDYVEKNSFPGVLIGLSGGIDSALVAAIATDALGPEWVSAVMMPSRYTSRASLEDAEACAKELGISLEMLEIEPAVEALEGVLADALKGAEKDQTEENIQSRIRGLLLMALSNKRGDMVLTTGNKSEMAVGYATLYGDMCGGYNPLKDMYKMQVYRLAEWRNSHLPAIAHGPEGEVIPSRILTKAPTAELRHDQRDQDSLPPYPVLDWILARLIEKEMSVTEMLADNPPEGVTPETVKKVARQLYLSEYKRRQAPPGPKLTKIAFGRDRRYPITSRYRSGG